MAARLTATSLTKACATALLGVIATGCAASSSTVNSARSPSPSTATGRDGSAPRSADTEADGAYYGARAAAFAKESLEEVAGTDFARMRRGRLYFRDGTDPHARNPLHDRLSEALQKKDSAAILQTTAEILAHDQADIRAHMLRAHALRATNDPHAAFHRAVAQGLFDSIVSSGDGRGTKTAWTAYRIKEEYVVLQGLGYVPRGQSLVAEGGKVFDRLDARKIDGDETVQFFFEITEMFATEGPELKGGQ